MSDSSASSKQRPRSAARANRAQVRAMHARAASTRMEQFSEADAQAANQIVGAATAVGKKRPAVRQIFLTRSQEYDFIRADMRRLIITAAALFVVMIAMLFILD